MFRIRCELPSDWKTNGSLPEASTLQSAVVYCINRDCPDFEETGFHAEFVAGVTVCPRCGQPLADELPGGGVEVDEAGEADGVADRHGVRLEPVFESRDPAEVPIVKGLLEAAGIDCLIEGAERFDALSGGRSPARFNPRAGSVVFLVPEPLAEQARELLGQLDESEETDD